MTEIRLSELKDILNISRPNIYYLAEQGKIRLKRKFGIPYVTAKEAMRLKKLMKGKRYQRLPKVA